MIVDAVSQILSRCSTPKTNICPTILYNEGWMTRLLVDASIQAQLNIPAINFGHIRHWYSEGLLSSPFLARSRRDHLAEGYTHADMALGDFYIDPSNQGNISIQKGTDGIFGVIEAKMGSQLSAGTKNAPNYDQASRNLACIAFNTLDTKHRIFFAVAAPQTKIDEYGIKNTINLTGMVNKIAQRFEMYDRNSEIYKFKGRVLARASTCTCFALSYESWIAALADHEAHQYLDAFRKLCYVFNRIA